MNVFKLEKYMAKYEFTAPYLLCCSDAESFGMQEIINMASEEDKKLWDNLKLCYTETPGLPLLREQIVLSLYPKLEANNILCFSGAEEGIFCALYTICNPGDNVIILTPCYQSLLEIPKLKGSETTTIALLEKNCWRIDLNEIKKAIKPNTKCLVINFPHNPTGQVITQEELKDLIDLCKIHDLWLFSDEVYRLLGTPEKSWAQPAAEMYPKALSLGVMSKAFGMAGLRIGWIACQDKNILQNILNTKHYTSMCNSGPAEIISLISLKNKDLILSRNNQIVTENLKLLDSFIEKHDDLFEWVKPQGGCTGFVRYKGEESIDDFAEKLVKKKGVLLMPASCYDHKSNYFRIGFGRKNMPEALNKLEEFLES